MLQIDAIKTFKKKSWRGFSINAANMQKFLWKKKTNRFIAMPVTTGEGGR